MTPRARVDRRSLDRADLDKAYNNAAAVANSAAMVAAWERRSATVRQQHGGLLDLPYGPRPRNRIDFLKSTARRADPDFSSRRLLANAIQGSLHFRSVRAALSRHQRGARRLYAFARSVHR